MNGDPIYVEYQPQNHEPRYKVLGATKAGRVLIGVWAPKDGRVRAVTAYPAGRSYERYYWENKE